MSGSFDCQEGRVRAEREDRRSGEDAAKMEGEPGSERLSWPSVGRVRRRFRPREPVRSSGVGSNHRTKRMGMSERPEMGPARRDATATIASTETPRRACNPCIQRQSIAGWVAESLQPIQIVLGCKPKSRSSRRKLFSYKELNQCERQELNLHGFPHWILSPARLPIPPLSRSRLAVAMLKLGDLLVAPGVTAAIEGRPQPDLHQPIGKLLAQQITG